MIVLLTLNCDLSHYDISHNVKFVARVTHLWHGSTKALWYLSSEINLHVKLETLR